VCYRFLAYQGLQTQKGSSPSSIHRLYSDKTGLLMYETLYLTNLIHIFLQKPPEKKTLVSNYVSREGKYDRLVGNISEEETQIDRYIHKMKRKEGVQICEFLVAALLTLKGQVKAQIKKTPRLK